MASILTSPLTSSAGLSPTFTRDASAHARNHTNGSLTSLPSVTVRDVPPRVVPHITLCITCITIDYDQYFTWANRARGSYRQPDSSLDPMLEVKGSQTEKEAVVPGNHCRKAVPLPSPPSFPTSRTHTLANRRRLECRISHHPSHGASVPPFRLFPSIPVTTLMSPSPRVSHSSCIRNIERPPVPFPSPELFILRIRLVVPLDLWITRYPS